MNQTRFNRKVLSATTTYIVFPKGQHYTKIEEALANKGKGTVREYTTIVKEIEIIPAKGQPLKARGTYVKSKEVKAVADATPPEIEPPF